MSLFRPSSPIDRRRSQRHDVQYLAQIDAGGGATPRSCIICDISNGGARLTIGPKSEVPEEFTLLFRRRCRVVRRSDGQIGVQFVSQ
jgi:PilZ domain